MHILKHELKSYIFRFVSILGDRYTGHVFDFIKKSKENKNVISILWDGNQKNHIFMLMIVLEQ